MVNHTRVDKSPASPNRRGFLFAPYQPYQHGLPPSLRFQSSLREEQGYSLRGCKSPRLNCRRLRQSAAVRRPFSARDPRRCALGGGEGIPGGVQDQPPTVLPVNAMSGADRPLTVQPRRNGRWRRSGLLADKRMDWAAGRARATGAASRLSEGCALDTTHKFFWS